jgi:hypothetical protein
MVAFALDPALMLTNGGNINPLRALATSRTTVGRQLALINSAGGVARWAAEASGADDGAPVIASPGILIHKADYSVRSPSRRSKTSLR